LIRVEPFLFLAILIGCGTSAPAFQRVESEPQVGRLFPELPDPNDTLVPSTHALPPCPALEPEDTTGWILRPMGWPSPRAPTLSLALPERFQSRSIVPPPGQADSAWAHLLGSWLVPRSDLRSPASYLAIWIGSEPSYATTGVPLGNEQLAFEECALGPPSMPGRMAVFTLRDSLGGLDRYVSAFWQAPNAAWVRAIAIAGDSSDSVGSRRAMSTLRLAVF